MRKQTIKEKITLKEASIDITKELLNFIKKKDKEYNLEKNNIDFNILSLSVFSCCILGIISYSYDNFLAKEKMLTVIFDGIHQLLIEEERNKAN